MAIENVIGIIGSFNMGDQDKYVSTLNAPLLSKAAELWAEDEDLRNETLQIIRDWISQQPHFTCRTGN